MSDTLLKIKLLFTHFLFQTISDWKAHIWEKDLDQHVCCDGRECGCYGSTIREMYTWKPKCPNTTSSKA